MFKILLSQEAIDNLEDIKNFIAVDNEQYSNKVIDIILNVVNNISYFPNLWKDVEWYDWLRELIEPNFWYRIVYRILDNKEIEIVTIFKYKDLFN